VFLVLIRNPEKYKQTIPTGSRCRGWCEIASRQIYPPMAEADRLPDKVRIAITATNDIKYFIYPANLSNLTCKSKNKY